MTGLIAGAEEEETDVHFDQTPNVYLVGTPYMSRILAHTRITFLSGKFCSHERSSEW